MAQTDKDLTNAVADFMDCSIVIPPTEIQDMGMLNPIIGFQKKMLRDRLRPIDNRLAFGDRFEGQHTVQCLQCTPRCVNVHTNKIKSRYCLPGEVFSYLKHIEYQFSALDSIKLIQRDSKHAFLCLIRKS